MIEACAWRCALDVFRLVGGPWNDGFVTADLRLDRSVVPGLVVLAVWTACGSGLAPPTRPLLALDVTLGAALVLGAFSMGRIFGKVWYYSRCGRGRPPGCRGDRVDGGRGPPPMADRRRADGGAAVVAIVGWGLGRTHSRAFGVRAQQHLSDFCEVVAPTVAALEQERRPGHGSIRHIPGDLGRCGNFGSQGYGLVNELERRGSTSVSRVAIPSPTIEVVPPGQATAELRLATGVAVDRVATLPGAVGVARYDLRPDGWSVQRLHDEVLAALVERGLDELVPSLDDNLFSLLLAGDLPREVHRTVDRMLVLGTTTVVFLLPPDSPR
jgi:hypothetical protein